MQKLASQFSQDGGSYENVRIGDIFTIGTGSLLGKNELIAGNVLRISAKADNNGVLGNFDTLNNANARHFENFISVNFFGDVFYHPYLASLEMKVHTLQLKNHTFTNKTGLYIAAVLRKFFTGKYGYGNQLSSSKLKEENFQIQLPHKDGKIAFDYMERWIAELEAERIAELEAYLMVTGLSDTTLTESENNALNALDGGGYRVNWKTVNLLEKFGNSTRGKRLKSADRIDGNLPFVTAGEADTGISAYIGNDVEIFPANTITIDMFGSAKYRDYPYGADDHVAVVHTEKMPKYATIFTTTAIHKASHAGQFDYSRNFYAKDADALNIQLPHTATGELDYTLMENLIRAIEKTVIKDVIALKDEIIKETKKIIAN